MQLSNLLIFMSQHTGIQLFKFDETNPAMIRASIKRVLNKHKDHLQKRNKITLYILGNIDHLNNFFYSCQISQYLLNTG